MQGLATTGTPNADHRPPGLPNDPLMQRETILAAADAAADVAATPLPQRLAGMVFAGGERGKVQRDAMVAFLVRVASAGLLYLTQVVLARWMGGYEFGIYVLAWTWVLILGGLSHLGLSVAMIRLLPAYAEAGHSDLMRGLLFGGRLLTIAVATAIAALGAAGVHALGPQLLSQHMIWPAYLALICLPMFALTDLQDGIGRGRGWMGAALLPPYVLRPLFLFLAMVGAHAAGWPMTGTTAVGAAIVATWLAAIVQTALMQQRLGREIEAGPRRYDFRGWLATSLPLLVIYGCELVLQNADLVILSMYESPAEIGKYFAAAKTMALVMFVHYAVGSAIGHKFSALNARGDREQLKAFVKDAVHWTFWPSLAAACGILVVGKPLLWLFSAEFTSAYPVMFILVLGFLVRASMGPAEFLLNMLGEQTLCAAVLLVTAALNIALNFALIPRFGIVGAAIATSAALVVAALLNYLVARRRLELEISIFNTLLK